MFIIFYKQKISSSSIQKKQNPFVHYGKFFNNSTAVCETIRHKTNRLQLAHLRPKIQKSGSWHSLASLPTINLFKSVRCVFQVITFGISFSIVNRRYTRTHGKKKPKTHFLLFHPSNIIINRRLNIVSFSMRFSSPKAKGILLTLVTYTKSLPSSLIKRQCTTSPFSSSRITAIKGTDMWIVRNR